MKKLLHGILAVTICISPILASASYLDMTNSSYTDDQIREGLYGVSSSYITNWTSSCPTDTNTIIESVNPTTFPALTPVANHVYILEAGDYQITTPKSIGGSCISFVGSGQVTIYSSGQQTDTLKINGAASNIILENITIDGAKGSPDHTNNFYGINIIASRGTVGNVSINNSFILNTMYALNIVATRAVSNVNLTNNTIQGNDYGVTIIENTVGISTGLTISGNELIGNGTGITDSSSLGATIDANIFSGNTTAGETGTNATGSNFPSGYLTDEMQCNNFGGCYCTPQADAIIADQAFCTDTTVTTWTGEASAYSCNDHDGCECSFDSNLYNFGDTSISCTDSTASTGVNEQLCTDPNGCTCFGTGITIGAFCTDKLTTTLTNGQTCGDTDGCVCNGAELAKGGMCRIVSSGGGGGGGFSQNRDNCPNGDYSSSYYDGVCGATPSNTDVTLGGVVEDDAFASYSIIDKAQLLAGEYNALVTAGQTTLRHGEFFAILYKYAKLKNISNTKLKAIIMALHGVFSKMTEAKLAQFGFDKNLLLQELLRLSS